MSSPPKQSPVLLDRVLPERAFQLLHELAVASAGLDPSEVATWAAYAAHELLDVDSAGLYWWDADRGELRSLAESAPNLAPAGTTLSPREMGISAWSFREGVPLLIDDYPRWKSANAAAVERGIRSAAAVPLRVRDTAVGVLTVRTLTTRHWTEQDTRLLILLAAQVAPSLEGARLHEESERRRSEAEALADLARQGAAEHDTPQLISLICDQAVKLAQADYSEIRLLDGETELLNVLEPQSTGHPADGGVELAVPLTYRGVDRGTLIVGWRSEVEPTADQVRLANALAGYAAVILENARAHAALAQQALYDELTDLPNRRLFQDRLEQAMLIAQRGGHPIALLLMDLDRFKEVNDTLGHQAGDVLLREIARRLRVTLRSSDTVARLGGDEFAVVLANMVDSDGATVTAGKLLAVVSEPMLLRGKSIQVATSVGIALFPEHGDDPETLLRHADVAMYVAKRMGGGSAAYSPEMDRDQADRLSLVQDLRRAVDEGQLVLEYQPRLNLATGTAEGVEALVRWNHPQQGMIPPSQFIPLAEQTGLIRRVSRWVLEAVFAQHRAWATAGRQLEIAVNLSMRDLHDAQLPNVISQLAQTYREQPDWLIVEITEGAMMSDPAAAQRTLAKLHTMGIRVAIDDFGTGYSSLSYLNQLAVDEIKVDRSFVDSMAANKKNYAIVRATIEMGHALGAAVVAEGVEDEAALELLHQLSCDGAQGFLLCYPLGADELIRWLESRH